MFFSEVAVSMLQGTIVEPSFYDVRFKKKTSKVVVFKREQVGSHWGKLFLKMICRHVSCLLPVRIKIVIHFRKLPAVLLLQEKDKKKKNWIKKIARNVLMVK